MDNNKKTGVHEVPLSIVCFMLIIYFLSGNTLFIKIGFGLGVLSLLSTAFSEFLTLVWSKIMMAVGFVNCHILLSLIFFLILIPLSFVYRLFKKDNLNLKSGKLTYYTTRDHLYDQADLSNPW